MKIYVYIANENINEGNIYIKKGDVFYIGVSKDIHQRNLGHTNISNQNKQLVNQVIQNHLDKYNVSELKLMIDGIQTIHLEKNQAHRLEMALVDMFNPQLNKYGKKK